MTARIEGSTSMVPARLFVRELQARGIDCSCTLRAAGLTREDLNDASGVLAWSECIALIRQLCKLVPSREVDALGVLAGARAELADLDLAGLFMRSNATVRDTVEFHQQHRSLLEPSPLTSMYLTDQAFVIALMVRTKAALDGPTSECLLASSLTLLRAISGPIMPIEVRLRHPRPADDTHQRRILGSALRYDSDAYALILPRALFDLALPHHDDSVQAVLQPHLARQIEATQARVDLSTRALAAIRDDLATGKPSAESLARRLRMSPRSLRRSLRVRDTTYSALLAEARSELALQYAVEAPRRSGPEIARLLGYADVHTFYRAFRRWTGVSLTAYRTRNGA